MEIIKAKKADMLAVQEIFLEYQIALNTPCCFQNFEKELEGLPGLYGSPTGVIFLAMEKNKVIGCVGIRPLVDDEDLVSNDTAELKRLFVQREYHGKGIGKKLFMHARDAANQLGYKYIVLETMDKMKQAKNLYRQNGFVSIPAYFENTEKDVECFRYTFS